MSLKYRTLYDDRNRGISLKGNVVPKRRLLGKHVNQIHWELQHMCCPDWTCVFCEMFMQLQLAQRFGFGVPGNLRGSTTRKDRCTTWDMQVNIL